MHISLHTSRSHDADRALLLPAGFAGILLFPTQACVEIYFVGVHAGNTGCRFRLGKGATLAPAASPGPEANGTKERKPKKSKKSKKGQFLARAKHYEARKVFCGAFSPQRASRKRKVGTLSVRFQFQIREV